MFCQLLGSGLNRELFSTPLIYLYSFSFYLVPFLFNLSFFFYFSTFPPPNLLSSSPSLSLAFSQSFMLLSQNAYQILVRKSQRLGRYAALIVDMDPFVMNTSPPLLINAGLCRSGGNPFVKSIQNVH